MLAATVSRIVMREVSKIIVRIDGFAEPTQLMSIKKAKGTPKHKKLEILGGGTDGQDAFEGLLRELEEEEKTGRLAQIVREQHPEPRSFSIAEAHTTCMRSRSTSRITSTCGTTRRRASDSESCPNRN